MVTKAKKYWKLIDQATNRHTFFPKVINQGRKSIVKWQYGLILPLLHPFKSHQQIDQTIPTTHQSTQQKSKQYIQFMPTLSDEWPQSCIGLILCEHNQNNQIYYVYGTGTLIHNKVVLTSAQNVYCRRLQKQYVNIKFIIGVNGNKCSRISNVKQMHYPKEYMMQQGYENYNFAVLKLQEDLSNICGYVGLKSDIKPAEKNLITYGYMSDNNKTFFKLQQIKYYKKFEEFEGNSGSGVLVKEKGNRYYIVGIRSQKKQYNVLTEKIRNIINQWTQETTIDINYIILTKGYQKIGVQGCKYMKQANYLNLTRINLYFNYIGSQGCKYLSQANWPNLIQINLDRNNIAAQGCKYLSQTNWPQLTTIKLCENNIDTQGCKYLSKTNWANLNIINLDFNYCTAEGSNNNIAAQGCKYLSQVNWKLLTTINLDNNNILAQGCQYLLQSQWMHLTMINLNSNNISIQGCQYLSQANWMLLNTLTLNNNTIGAQGCKYLSQANWKHLNIIQLGRNGIDAQGCRYLSQTDWIYLIKIKLDQNNLDREACLYMCETNWIHLTKMQLKNKNNINCVDMTKLKQLWRNADIGV